MIYELRIYHCLTGRLPKLLQRFEQATLAIWDKHGIRQAGFWTVVVGPSNQALYYLITGGFVGLVLYAVLIVTVYRLLPAHALEGKVIRALVVAYVFMGLGGEVLQLSVHGNIFWLVVGLCLASYPKRHELSSA